MARTPDGLPHPDQHDESVQLAHVCEDLQREFPAVPPEVVEDQVTREEQVFTRARVRSFVPVLVRRRARERLRELG